MTAPPQDGKPQGSLFAEFRRRGSSALLIKVASAVLAPLSLVAIARLMPASEYGLFAFAFSLAMLLGIVGNFGQSSLALKTLPILRARDDAEGTRGYILYAYGVVLGASTLLTGIVLLGGSLSDTLPTYIAIGVLLTVPMALSELQSGVLRGFGSIWRALAPRDVVWRLLIAVACLPLLLVPLWADHLNLTANWALAGIGILLMLVVVVQLISHRGIVRAVLAPVSPHFETRSWTSTSVGLWANAILQRGTQHLAIVLAGFSVAAADVAGLFAALKLALLMNFFLLAASLAAAPIQSRAWHEGRRDDMQRLCTYVAMAATLPSLALFFGFAILGNHALNIFGDGYEEYWWCLMILAVGQLVNAMSGQTSFVLNVTGNERVLLRQMAPSSLIPLATLPFLAPVLGVVYAAIAIAVSQCLWNIQAAAWARRHLHLNTTVFSAWGLKKRIGRHKQ